MSNSNTERKGEIFALLSASLWGIFPVITSLTFNTLSPLLSLAWSTFFSAIFFGIIITFKRKWSELANISALKDIFMVALLIGVLFYSLYFIGLKYTSAGNASIIALSETFFCYLFFNFWRKEYFSYKHILGSALMVSGAVIVLLPNFTAFKAGDLIILVAATLAPFGNFFMRRARQKVSSDTIMFGRSVLTIPAVLILAYVMKEKIAVQGMIDSVWFLVINGFVLLGLAKVFWIEGIHRISVTKANALGAVTPVVTLILAWIFLSQPITVWQIAALIPMFFGMILLNGGARQSEQ